MTVMTDIKNCCITTAQNKYPDALAEATWTSKTKINASLPRGCYYNTTTLPQITYSEGPGENGRNIKPHNGWKPVNIDQCLSEKIHEEEKLEIDYKQNAELMIHQKNDEIEKINKENKNRLYTGFGIGAIITITSCILIFIFAKLKLIPLFYNKIIELLEQDKPLLIGITIVSLIVLSIFSYLVFVVYGGKGKRTIISGSFQLNKTKTTNEFDYNKGNIDTDSPDQSYIFWLKINEKNKASTDEEQHIFHVGHEKSMLQYPAVWFNSKKNILTFTFSTKVSYNRKNSDVLEIDIDNIEFEEWFHVGIVINNDNMSPNVDIYINSKLVVSKLVDSGKFITKEQFTELKPKVFVGGWKKNKTIDGEIKDLYNYNRALTHKDIETHYLSLLVVTQGYIRYMYNILSGIILYPKHLLFSSGDGDTCP